MPRTVPAAVRDAICRNSMWTEAERSPSDAQLRTCEDNDEALMSATRRAMWTTSA
jgi:hypothetical protein